MLLIWDLCLQLLPNTVDYSIYHSFTIILQIVSIIDLEKLVVYSIDFAVSLSSFNDRKNISQEIFSHLLPTIPLLKTIYLMFSSPVPSFTYSSLLHYFLQYTNINSNLPSVILQLFPYLTEMKDFIALSK